MNKKVTAELRAEVEAFLRTPEGAVLTAARKFGLSTWAVGRIRDAAGIPPREPGTTVRAGEHRPRLDASAETRDRIRREDEVKRLNAEIRRLHRQELDDDAIKILLGRMKAAPVEPPGWLGKVPPARKGKPSPEVPVTIWSDWHFGEVVSRGETGGINTYDIGIAEERVHRLVDGTIHLCREHHTGNYPGIVINLLGDFVSGGLHPELLKTDAEEQIPSALRVRDVLVGALDRMIEAFGRVYAPCASGNHGRATLKPEAKRYVYKNFDWLIYQLLARHYANDKRIVFDIPEANEVHYRVFGQRYLALHGDQLGVKGGDGIIGMLGPIARGEVKVGKQASAMGRDYDVLLMGHWHQALFLPRVIVAGALKGFDEYAKLFLRAPPTEPSQPLWFVHPRRGLTCYWPVKVREPAPAGREPWVSFEGKAA